MQDISSVYDIQYKHILKFDTNAININVNFNLQHTKENKVIFPYFHNGSKQRIRYRRRVTKNATLQLKGRPASYIGVTVES